MDLPVAPSRMKSLDGLRGVSILLVLLGHVNGTQNFGSHKYWLGDIAHLGVQVFFVLSGFLITSLLADEDRRNNGVSLPRFYARRALRILPASLAYLAAIGPLSLAGAITLHDSDIWHAITHTVNMEANRSWYVGHLWSLSVEEQFYLLWPFAFVLTGRHVRTRIAVAVVCLGPVARFAAWRFLRGTSYQDLPLFPMVADALAAGCLLALLRNWLEMRPRYLSLFRPAPSLGILAATLVANCLMDYTAVRVLGAALVNLSIALLIHRCVYCWRDPIGRVLNWRPLAFLGTISYSLYIWQQPFLNRESTAWLAAFPVNIVCAVAMALVSWRFVEQPFLAMRHRFSSARRTEESPQTLAAAA